MWPSAHQRVPRALQGRVRVPRALHGREGRLTRLAPAPRALGARAMSDDEQTQLETHAPMEGGAQLSHGPGTAAETGAAALAGAAEAVTDPPATLRARMIADLADFVPASTNVAAVADTLLDQDFESMHDVMEVDLTASDLLARYVPFRPGSRCGAPRRSRRGRGRAWCDVAGHGQLHAADCHGRCGVRVPRSRASAAATAATARA